MRNILFLLLIFNFACKGQKGMKKLDEQPLNVSLELILKDNYSGIKASGNDVIKDKKTLQKFFSEINKMRKPGIQMPEIDFSTEVVVVLCEGEHEATFSMAFEVFKETEKVLKLRNVRHSEKETSKARVTPFKIYKYNTTKKDIVFDK